MNSILSRCSKSIIRIINFETIPKSSFLKYACRKSTVVKNSINLAVYRKKFINGGGLYITFSLTLFGFSSKDKETPEDKLIASIKRSILCIQREQYDKAEQMLHLSLRMAQDLQSKDGITYVYDVMANLAMEREQFKKAEKLFTDVMKRLLIDGHSDGSPKVLHISSKLAHMAHLQGDFEKAKVGFTWTLQKIEEGIKKMPDDIDLKELWGLTTNWFGQLLMKEENFKEAIQCFKDAYDCFIKIHGTFNEEAITILNNLSVACVHMGNFVEARLYITEALTLVKDVPNTSQEGVLQANLGLIYLREGLVNEAKKSCTQAWKTGKNQKNDAAIEQAEYCLNEINTFKKGV